MKRIVRVLRNLTKCLRETIPVFAEATRLAWSIARFILAILCIMALLARCTEDDKTTKRGVIQPTQLRLFDSRGNLNASAMAFYKLPMKGAERGSIKLSLAGGKTLLAYGNPKEASLPFLILESSVATGPLTFDKGNCKAY